MTALTASNQVQKVRSFKNCTSSNRSGVRRASSGAASSRDLQRGSGVSSSATASTTAMRGWSPRPKGTSTMLPGQTLPTSSGGMR